MPITETQRRQKLEMNRVISKKVQKLRRFSQLESFSSKMQNSVISNISNRSPRQIIVDSTSDPISGAFSI